MTKTRVIAGVAAGAFVVIAAWAAKEFGAVTIPIEVQGAIQALITAIVQLIPGGSKPVEDGSEEPTA